MGANTGYNSQTGEPCGETLETRCDAFVLHVGVDPIDWSKQLGGVQIDVDFDNSQLINFDLYIYKIDGNGNRGELIDHAASFTNLDESAFIYKASGDYLVQVVYAEVLTPAAYTGKAAILADPTAMYPATGSRFLMLPEEVHYVPTRGGANGETIDLYVRLVRPDVPDPDHAKVPTILLYSPYSDAFTTVGTAGTLFGGDPNGFDAMPLWTS